MATFPEAYLLDDAEIDRLEEVLASEIFHGEAMRLDELQALFCAVVSAPEPVLPSIWIPAALGAAPVYETEAQMQEVMGVLMRFYNETAETLARGAPLQLVLYPVDAVSDDSDYGAWADAYLYGIELCAMDWFEAAGEYADDLSDLLNDFYLLNGAVKEDVRQRGETWMSEAAERQALQRAAENLAEQVAAIYDFWQALRFPAQTVRRESPDIGRNELCPCGSGKKYKRCCGDPKKLH